MNLAVYLPAKSLVVMSKSREFRIWLRWAGFGNIAIAHDVDFLITDDVVAAGRRCVRLPFRGFRIRKGYVRAMSSEKKH